MVANRDTWEWHLTPRGWVQGDMRTLFDRAPPSPPPPDRVLTVTWVEELSSAFSTENRWWRSDYESSDKDAVEALQRQFGKAPAGYEDR